jgi:hypothetical protein
MVPIFSPPNLDPGFACAVPPSDSPAAIKEATGKAEMAVDETEAPKNARLDTYPSNVFDSSAVSHLHD